MLVLSRKQGQSIIIANDIVVRVVNIGHGRVQIAVTAPPHLPIHREEVHRRIQKETRSKVLLEYTSPPEVTAGCVGSV
jgi:carbon storage regulator